MTNLWRNYSLSITLFALFAIAWALQTWAGYVAHVEAGESGNYLWVWLQATAENHQSEFLQLAIMVVFTTYLVHKNSPQSRDGSDRLEAKVDELLRMQTRREE